MKIELRRYATLARTDVGLPGQAEEIALDEGATVADLLAALDLPADAVHLVIVNGRIYHDRSAPMADGDRVALFPPIGGG